MEEVVFEVEDQGQLDRLPGLFPVIGQAIPGLKCLSVEAYPDDALAHRVLFWETLGLSFPNLVELVRGVWT